MCGIFGYLGNKAISTLIDGLKTLEYRGYDSAGIALLNQNRLQVYKTIGNVSKLEEILVDIPHQTNIGIAHTRWATHGRPSTYNAHPHTNSKGTLAIVHNGIIENVEQIKQFLKEQSYHCHLRSETDTEVLVHLITYYRQILPEQAVQFYLRSALRHVEGSYAIALICEDEDTLVVARYKSPLILGLSLDTTYISSDPIALTPHTQQIIYLEDNDIAVINEHGVNIYDTNLTAVMRDIISINRHTLEANKGTYPHFMLKEIHEQSSTLKAAMANQQEIINVVKTITPKTERILLGACGTSWYASLVSEYFFEQLANITCEVEQATEMVSKNAFIDSSDVFIAVSQSGETADTLEMLQQAKDKGAYIIAIVNRPESTIAREADAVIQMHVGAEIGVASTKAFTAAVTILYRFALELGLQRKMLEWIFYERFLTDLERLPVYISEVLALEPNIQEIASSIYKYSNMLYLGRGLNWPIALEGALKTKETSYVHAEAVPASEMKHGPIALIDQHMPSVFIVGNEYKDRLLSNMIEIKTRDGYVIAIGPGCDKEMTECADYSLSLPVTNQYLQTIINVIPLQLLAYYIANARNCPIDKPRNLAKCVTVH